MRREIYNLNRRVGVALAFIGGFGLGVFWLYVSAGNLPNLPILAALLLSFVGGVILVQRNKPLSPPNQAARFRLLRGDQPEGMLPPEPPPPPKPKKKPKKDEGDDKPKRRREKKPKKQRGKDAEEPPGKSDAPEEEPPKKKRGLFGRG